MGKVTTRPKVKGGPRARTLRRVAAVINALHGRDPAALEKWISDAEALARRGRKRLSS